MGPGGGHRLNRTPARLRHDRLVRAEAGVTSRVPSRVTVRAPTTAGFRYGLAPGVPRARTVAVFVPPPRKDSGSDSASGVSFVSAPGYRVESSRRATATYRVRPVL